MKIQPRVKIFIFKKIITDNKNIVCVRARVILQKNELLDVRQVSFPLKILIEQEHWYELMAKKVNSEVCSLQTYSERETRDMNRTTGGGIR